MPTKVRLVKAMVFLVVMYGCEFLTVKKAERKRIDAFELWCWRRLLRVPCTTRRSNQSILKEMNPGCSLEGMMLKLKLQYFGHFMQRVDSLEKTDAGRDWGQEEKGMTEDEMAGWHHRLDGREFEWTPGDGDGQGGLACCDSLGLKESDTTEQLNWTELKVRIGNQKIKSLVTEKCNVRNQSPESKFGELNFFQKIFIYLFHYRKNICSEKSPVFIPISSMASTLTLSQSNQALTLFSFKYLCNTFFSGNSSHTLLI